MKDSISVLIVDDERIQRNILKNMMLGLGKEYHFEVKVLEASDGVEAITKLGRDEVDLVLLDWNMPLCSGGDFIKTVRSTEKCRDLPVVMISADTNQKTIIESLRAGACEYIIKPVDDNIFRKKLISTIQKLN